MIPQEPFGLVLQRLRSDTERVLVAGEVAGVRNGGLRFTTADVIALFDLLHVPQPSNVSARLAQLRSKKLVVRNRDESWALTPGGRLHAQGVVGQIDKSRVRLELAALPGAALGGVRHSSIPPILAPLKWSQAATRLHEKSPFEKNVFLMTRFPQKGPADVPPDPLEGVIEAIDRALSDHGLKLHRADDRQLDDDLLGNVAGYMWACQYGIGLIENRVGHGVNHNVLIELGGMLMTGRRCGILRDTVTEPDLPSDFVGQIYKPVDFDDHAAVAKATHDWVALDLGLGSCPSCESIPA
ncbi:MAG: hypothetical protein M3134_08830 [Actinomycetota bacterium]|nr:hypothetical protein [Actinomycetota bacterium]